MVDKFNENGLVDTYHHLNNEKQGEESEATFFMYRHLDKPFHLDHVFTQPGLINDLKVQDKEKWTQLSDHVPIVFDINYDMSNTIQKEYFDIPTPTAGEVEMYIDEWYSLENYVNQENSLNKLFFDLIPENKLIEDILIKSSTLNDFYSTRIFSIFPVAKHIYQLDIDKRLNDGDLTLVNDIADVKKLNRRFYSFASKYCSHHNPELFPIYDSYVDKILRYFRKKDKFANFSNNDLKDYVKFNDILNQFSHYYSLEQFSLKELDRYLWQLGKRYFKNK